MMKVKLRVEKPKDAFVLIIGGVFGLAILTVLFMNAIDIITFFFIVSVAVNIFLVCREILFCLEDWNKGKVFRVEWKVHYYWKLKRTFVFLLLHLVVISLIYVVENALYRDTSIFHHIASFVEIIVLFFLTCVISIRFLKDKWR